jgi:lysozyme
MRKLRTRVGYRAPRIIRKFEGGQSADGKFHPYLDPVGIPTIGFGHTKGVTMRSKPLTLRQALSLLKHDLNQTYAPSVVRLCKSLGLKLEQYEFDALVSAIYNLGPGVLDRRKTLGSALRTAERMRIADAFTVYVYAGGKKLPGLVNRRKAERNLYLHGKV